jgi:uridine kinase
MSDVALAVSDRVLRKRPRAVLVALSGIDGSGKTALAGPLASEIERLGLRVAVIGVDPWQNPQCVRFSGVRPGEHFYAHAIRFDALFDRLVRPLVADRSIHLRVQGIRTDRDVYESLEYRYEDIDVVLLEGIFLLQARYDSLYDVRVWVECSFASALERAIARNAEGLPVQRLREDYARIYHAAQRHHFELDEPRRRADFVIPNETSRHAAADIED